MLFLSNAFTPHQKHLSFSFDNLFEDYKFIECNNIDKSKLPQGWKENESPDFVVDNESFNSFNKHYINCIENDDVVIVGAASDKLIAERLKKGKLTFKYAERLYKGKLTISQWIRAYIGTYIHYIRFKKHNFYVLCSSAYTAADINKFFNFKDKCIKWGYFPETKKYDNINNIIEAKENNSILWCARLIDWKHPEVPVLVAEKLKKDGYKFKLNIIGGGELEEEIQKLIDDKNLNDCVTMVGVIQQDEVRDYMEKSEIFLFTSDSNEGWGAVLNEAMNSGCACVSSHAIGSAPYLTEDGENGFLYRDGDFDDLYKKVTLLLDNPDKCKEIGEKAYLTITQEWNADVAAVRFYELSQAILSGNKNPDLYQNGPCSRAQILRNNWY